MKIQSSGGPRSYGAAPRNPVCFSRIAARQRREASNPAMRTILFAAFLALPLLEIGVLIYLGQHIGFWWTLALIVSTAAIGVSVLNRQGFTVMIRAMEAMNNGKPPIGPVVDGAFVMLAGLLLIAPGLITDTMGALLLLPPLRHRFAAWSVRQALRAGRVHVDVFTQTARRQAGATSEQGHATGGRMSPDAHVADGPVIDGEFERVDEETVDLNRRTRDGKRPPPGTNGSSESYRAR
jgi:UPF0716 protein FxsA